MNTGGWLMMGAFWIGITIILVLCLYKVVNPREKRKRRTA